MNRVNEVTKDCMNALISLRAVALDDAGRPELVHQRIQSCVDEAIARGKSLGIVESDLADITYALVAYADEVAQRRPGALRDYWHQQPLQLRYFGENVAGDGFFERLQWLLHDPSRVEALVIYHSILAFGFQGRYAVRGGELELDLVRRRVREALGRILEPADMSIHHLPPSEPARVRRLDNVVLWVGLYSLLFSVCFLTALRISLDSLVDQQSRRAGGVLQQIGAGEETRTGGQ